MALNCDNNCIEKWKLDELDNLLNDIEDEIANGISKNKIKADEDYTNIVLHTVGKAMVTMREIICLSKSGYPDGALSLARNIYEQLIILLFFENHINDNDFEKYVNDYYNDYQIQRLKALKYDSEFCTRNSEQLTQYDIELKLIKQKSYSKETGTYWWTNNKKLNFYKLVRLVTDLIEDEQGKNLLHNLHFIYKRACISLHSSCMGNIVRLGSESEFNKIDTTPTAKGHSLPLWFSMASLGYVIGITYARLNIDFKICESRMSELVQYYGSNQKYDI